ncbi:malto-oligosyltrehalose synthase [Paracoccus sp. NSM]|uniref:malto-oligosyltrehalose synthase n=1 Tax=Paracoccus sp. NSM TaxID=3457784 RepID=UPI0040364419
MIPLRATYRLQFNADFRFADAAALAPYLASMGVSHVYASPIFTARPGSTHGYDVTDYNRLNPELGSRADFDAMVATLRGHDLGLILDFVPNHMGIGGDANAFWDSVMEWGPDSPWAHWFDIDWHRLDGKVLFPFLGAAYGTVLAEGGLRLHLEQDGRLAVRAHDSHRLPINPHDYAQVLERAGSPLAAEFAAMAGAGPRHAGWPDLFARLAQAGADLSPYDDPALLDALIGRQHWRAASFTLDADAINYRRFFTISDLAGVRVEDPRVFDETHALILSLLRDGSASGIRIDHIDGLRDPGGYCRRLRQAVGRPFWLFVEKILGPGEDLPPDWSTDGTTGYEFANQVVTLLADPAGEDALDRIYAEETGQSQSPDDIVHEAKLAVMSGPMRAEAEALTDALAALAAGTPQWADLGRGAIREALTQVIAALDVYRTYGDAEGMPRESRKRIESALARARLRAPDPDPAVWDLLGATLTLDGLDAMPDRRGAMLAALTRFQQLSGPVMAKGLEDRALYRFNRLIALNEVGSHPGDTGLSVAAFHAAQAARLARLPQNMLCTASHDTKRGEDARMRILAISSNTKRWQAALDEWRALLGDAADAVDPNERYFLYQLLLGLWPENGRIEGDLPERVHAGMLKSVREAAVNTRWINPDEGYEGALDRLITRALTMPAFRASFARFVSALRADAEAASLIQTALKLTVPGVPDLYQGAEAGDHSLVDPDNRRPADFDLRRRLLSEWDGGPIWSDDAGLAAEKLRLTAALLRLRAKRPGLFARGSYRPLLAVGEHAQSVLAFLRDDGADALMVVAAVHPVADWSGLALPHPGGPLLWCDILSGHLVAPDDPQALFAQRRLAILKPV